MGNEFMALRSSRAARAAKVGACQVREARALRTTGDHPSEDSEEVGLLHDAKELLLVHLAVAIAICLIDHLLQLLIGHSLTKLLRDALQVLKGYLPSLVVVEQAEGFQDFILRVTVQDLVCHHLKEFFVANCAAAVVIDIRDHLLNLLLLRLETERAHSYLQLFG